MPKVVTGDKLRAILDMDSGELRFSLYKSEDAAWKEIPGALTGIKGPVVAACCIQVCPAATYPRRNSPLSSPAPVAQRWIC